MPIIGSVELEVGASAEQVIKTLDSMRGSFAKFAEGVRQELAGIGKDFNTEGILGQFDVKGAAESFFTITKLAGDLEGTLRQLGSVSKDVELFPRFKEVIAELEGLQDKLKGGLGIPLEEIREQEALQAEAFERELKFLQETSAANQQAHEEEKTRRSEIRQIRESLFKQESEEAAQLAKARRDAWEASAKAAEEAADRELKAQEKLGAELNASINRVNPQLAKDRQREFDVLAARASGVTEASGKLSGAFDHLAQRGGVLGGVAGKLGGIFAKAEGALAGFGLSVSDVSILLGTGFAGGVAGVLLIATEFIKKIGEMIAAVIKFGIEAAKIGSQFNALQANIEATFGDGAALVREFSEQTALAFGVSQVAALDYLNSVGQLFQSFDIAQDSAARMSVALFAVAEGLRRGHEANVTFEQSLKDVQDVLSGNLEATRERLKFTQNEEDLKRIAEGLKSVGIEIEGTFTSAERGLLSLLGLVEEARTRLGRIPEAPRTLSEIFEVTRAVVDDLVKDLGTTLAPVLTQIADLVLGVVVVFSRGVENILRFIKGIDDFVERSPALQIALDALVKSLQAMFPVLFVAAKIMGLFTDEGKQAREEAKAYADELANLDGISQDVIESLKGLNDETELTEENLQQLADAHIRYQRAVEDANRSITDAELNLARSREDAAERTRDATRENQRSLQDANEKIEDANIKLQRAQEDNQRNLEKTLRDHNRKRADINRDHLRKLQDFALQEKDIRDKNRDAILDANLAIGQALRKGDLDAERAARLSLTRARDAANQSVKDLRLEQERELQDFRRDAAREQQDRITDLNDLEIESTRRIFDANKDLQEAFEDRQRAFEDAMERLDDLERENTRRLFDAQKRLDDAHIRAKRSIDDAAKALDILNEKFGTQDQTLAQILDKLERIKNALIDVNANLFDFSLPFSPGFVEPPQGASGFRNFQGGYAIVGEDGPELAQLPRGTNLFSNPETRRLFEQLAQGRGPTVHVHEVANDPEATAYAVLSRLFQGA